MIITSTLLRLGKSELRDKNNIIFKKMAIFQEHWIAFTIVAIVFVVLGFLVGFVLSAKIAAEEDQEKDQEIARLKKRLDAKQSGNLLGYPMPDDLLMNDPLFHGIARGATKSRP